jgi:thiol-disulfide isomerase/thioredoxin
MKTRNLFLIIIIFAIGLVIIFGLIRSHNIKDNRITYNVKQTESHNKYNVPQFEMPIVNGNGRYIYTPNNYNRYYLFIIFTPWDCINCLKEIPFWNAIEKKIGNKIEVIGISTAENIRLLKYFIDNNNVQIITLYDEKEIIMGHILSNAKNMTPIKVLVDKSGTIIDETPSLNGKAQVEYLNRIKKIIE